MKKSLKRRIDVSFLLLIAITLAVIGVVHFLFIENVYINSKKKILTNSYDKMNETLVEDNNDSFMSYCEMNGLSYVVADANLTEVSANTKDADDMLRLLFGNILDMEKENKKILYESNQYQIVSIEDRKDGIEFLMLWGMLTDGNYYVVRYPMSNIQEAAKISLIFYLVIGAMMLVLSAFIIKQITKRLTKPISELNDLSNRMADMDFEAKYTSGGEDEIGQLGRNLNEMSNKLELSISELKSANVKLSKDLEEKEKIDERRREFLSNVSHELKTPIALVQGYAEGLKEMIQDPESRDYYCDVIIDEANKMNHLVRQLLSLNQLESGRDEVDMTRFDLRELINGVLSASSIMIEKKNVTVINNVSNPIYVWGDEFKIEQVLTNYISNALNHVEGENKIHINCDEQNGIVTTTVFNTGKPIPKEDLDNIWTKFYKVDKARTREYGGSGIGLSIVKAIIDLHGQKCWAENYENGVAFKFTLSSK